MSGISEEYLRSILHKIATEHHIHDWSYNEVKFESIAQNYFGILIPVVLSGKRNGEDVGVHLVLKLAPTNEQYRVSGAVSIMFAREIFVYSVVLKKYQELQKDVPIRSQYIIPRCYYIKKEFCKEAIALRDMRTDGYKSYTHEMFLDLDHTLISLKSLAGLHVLSFVLKNDNTTLYEKISTTCEPLTLQTNLRFMDIMQDRLNKALNKFEGTEYIPLLHKLNQDCAKYFSAAVDSVQNTCICHGDMWKENILYKYEGKKPVSACIIDYQTARICSPAYDTMYLIVSSTSAKLREKYFHNFLETYYQSFEIGMKNFNLDSDKIYSRQMFENDLRVVTPACLITANTALWLTSGLQEEGHVRSKHVLNTKEERDLAVEKYMEIVRGIIDDLSRYGYLSLDM